MTKFVNIACNPIDGQRPGTSGLRKKTRIFMQPGYLESFVQAIFNAIGGGSGKTFVLGGDGRFFNAAAIQTILKIAAANGVARMIVGQNGLLSTPAVSHLIRLNETDGGFILSASHNPGGIEEDFGLKFNTPNGGPAPENITEAMYEQTLKISSYAIASAPDIDLSSQGRQAIGNMHVDVVDLVNAYQPLMEALFDFDKIRALFASGFTMRFDAMHAVTGPYAVKILQDILGASDSTVLNATPSEDFGGGHPDPNPVWAKPLIDLMMSRDAPDFGAASDGDGDRNMIVGRGIYVTPSDSLAVLVANAHLAPGYRSGLAGVARSMPTSRACDRVAEKLGIDAYETPTGWKFFGNLLDAGKATICGEESAGTGSSHIREKDGLWAVLLWLNIIAERGQSVAEILADHWREFGRNYYSRHDYEAVPADVANQLMSELDAKLPELAGKDFSGMRVMLAETFSYADPVDGSLSENQGIVIHFERHGRAVLRLSGTGTEGATLRIYLEQYVDPNADHSVEPQAALTLVKNAIHEITRIQALIGRTEPDVMT